MYIFNEQQMNEFIGHIAGISMLLPKVKQRQSESEIEGENVRELEFESEDYEPRGPMATGISFESLCGMVNSDKIPPSNLDEVFSTAPAEATPRPSLYPDRDETERRKMDRIMSLMCGRWTPGANRCGIEIIRRGDFLTLNYLKRNGCLRDLRFVLLPFDDGSFICYTPGDRMVSVTLDIETDTLMISPGVDYTRIKG
jgi:hypothetical protein